MYKSWPDSDCCMRWEFVFSYSIIFIIFYYLPILPISSLISPILSFDNFSLLVENTLDILDLFILWSKGSKVGVDLELVKIDFMRDLMEGWDEDRVDVVVSNLLFLLINIFSTSTLPAHLSIAISPYLFVILTSAPCSSIKYFSTRLLPL